MKLIVLDRDGVINQDSDHYIKTVEEWVPIPGAIEAIARLSKAGYAIAVATNQSGLARGYFSQATLDAMHDKLRKLVQQQGGDVDMIAYCPHGPDDDCDCRKPLPGLFQQIASHFGLPDLQQVPVVGDTLRDLEAGMSLGCIPYLVRTGKGERYIAKGLPSDWQITVMDDLSAVADSLLNSDER